ncbi:hypothetical protein K3G63_11085 [Hymenobacter sp. HSC-4F20]|uniref:hypothetical protein n=1 Tax=Hymenobacter sp. HSC-4F20 TaxID=2864135 RepID=UPI001C72D83A|nr:hypothetical protein [Hymenobacter sp. HSC-4F20]MBX0290987.1 hypothetical protein [Hymenobacter sp. HSC-4F20]
MLSPSLKPATPVNPAERPIANAVLMSALLDLHPLENFNAIQVQLSEKYPDLKEEIYEALEQAQEARLSDTCKVIQLQA